MSANSAIGMNNKLPWKCKGDMDFFKNKTTGKQIIVGRKTFESMGSKGLPDRKTYVLSSTDMYAENATVVHPSHLCHITNEGETFVCGGEQVYKLLLPRCAVCFLTVLNRISKGDAFFPTSILQKNFILDETIEICNDYTIFKYINKAGL